MLFIVFAETGLFAGFFLPGDSLLFLAGIYNRELIENILFIDSNFVNVVLLATMVALAGILGNIVGYWFGSKSGFIFIIRKITFGLRKNTLYNLKLSLKNTEEER